MMKYYTYLHIKADTGEIFYVGKGMPARRRASSRLYRSLHWHNVVAKHGLKIEIAAFWATEDEAFAHEKLLICSLRGLGVPLVNLTDGGDGTSGFSHSDEFREWQSRRVAELFKDAEYKRRHGEAQRQRFSDPAARAEHGLKISGGWTPEKRAMMAGKTLERFAEKGHPRQKLFDHDIEKMIAMRLSGIMVKDIAKILGISRTRVTALTYNKTQQRIKSKAPGVRDMAKV